MRFYGRTAELRTLHELLDSCQTKNTCRLAVVTGRRRIGKTTLIEEAFRDCGVPYIYFFTSVGISETDFCVRLIKAVSETLDIKFPPTLTDASDTFSYVLELAKSHAFVLAIDECQDAESRVPDFWSKLQKAWDLNKDGGKLLLVLSGSIQSTIERVFGSESSPLFGRADLFMVLQPFTTRETEAIFYEEFPAGQNEDLLTLYAVTGGVARYLAFFADWDALSSRRLLECIFSEKGSWYQAEGILLLSNEFRTSTSTYLTILQLVASGVSKRSELQDRLDVDISPYLQRLETNYRLIERTEPILQKKSNRNFRYKIKDPFFRYWFAFISQMPQQSYIERGLWEPARVHAAKMLPAFLGRTLEDWFIKRCLENPAWCEVGSWWDRKGQNEIDLIAIDRACKRILIAEVKLNRDKYDEYRLRKKIDVFLEHHPELSAFDIAWRPLSIENMRDLI